MTAGTPLLPRLPPASRPEPGEPETDADDAPDAPPDTPGEGVDEHYSLRYCPHCNIVFRARLNTPSPLCSACQQTNEQDYRERVSESRRQDPGFPRKTGTWELRSDPLPIAEGGFSPGVHFDTLEMGHMLETRAFCEGTRLRYNNRTYTVRERECEGGVAQYLVAGGVPYTIHKHRTLIQINLPNSQGTLS